MAYKPNIPLPTDQISVSQGDLLGNFQQLNTAFLINHNDWNGANAGKHKQVTMMNAGSPSFANTEYALYNNGTNLNLFNGPANTTVAIAGTGSTNKAASGYTYLPSGIIIQWGTKTGVSTAIGTVIAFPITFPNAIFSITGSPTNHTSGVGESLSAVFFALGTDQCGVGLQSSKASGNNANISWIAIGY